MPVDLPNELWMAILRHVPSSDDLQGFYALWRLRSLNTRFRQLVEATLVSYFHDFSLQIQVEMKSLEYKAVFTNGSNNQQQQQNNHQGASTTTTSSRTNSNETSHSNNQHDRLSFPLAASLSGNGSGDFTREIVGLDQLPLACGGFDRQQGVYEFVPVIEAPIRYARLGSADSIRDVRISFDGWRSSFEKRRQQLFSDSSVDPLEGSLRSERLSKNPYHHRVYRMDLNNIPGVHYLGERDLLLQYTLRRFEQEVVRHVPKPGGAPGTTMPLRAYDVHYEFQLDRILVRPWWLIQGMRRYGKTPPRDTGDPSSRSAVLFPEAIQRLWTALQQHPRNPFSSLDEVNLRSELVFHYLSKYYQQEHVEPFSTNASTLAAVLVDTHGLPDRRHRVERILGQEREKWLGLLQWLQLPVEESFWFDEALVRFLLGKSTPVAPYPSSVTFQRTTPVLEFDGLVTKYTGDHQPHNEQLLQEAEKLVKRWYDKLLGELKLSR